MEKADGNKHVRSSPPAGTVSAVTPQVNHPIQPCTALLEGNKAGERAGSHVLQGAAEDLGLSGEEEAEG